MKTLDSDTLPLSVHLGSKRVPGNLMKFMNTIPSLLGGSEHMSPSGIMSLAYLSSTMIV